MAYHHATRTKVLSWFLNDAFDDYIAARYLLLAGLPKQPVLLSSTAPEKCIKAVLATRGNQSSGHLKNAHCNVYEVRRDPVRGLFEMTYLSENPAKMPGFLRAALAVSIRHRTSYRIFQFLERVGQGLATVFERE